MQIVVLPVLGWGVFGLAITGFPPKIAVGTGVLHLVYGGVLGWGVNQKHVVSIDSRPRPNSLSGQKNKLALTGKTSPHLT